MGNIKRSPGFYSVLGFLLSCVGPSTVESIVCMKMENGELQLTNCNGNTCCGEDEGECCPEKKFAVWIAIVIVVGALVLISVFISLCVCILMKCGKCCCKKRNQVNAHNTTFTVQYVIAPPGYPPGQPPPPPAYNPLPANNPPLAYNPPPAYAPPPSTSTGQQQAPPIGQKVALN